MSRRFVFVLLVALVTAWPAAAFADAPRAWMTTGDQKNLLTEQPARAFGDPADAIPTITIDPAQTFQRIEGFGASTPDSSAPLLAASRSRDSIMRDLFAPQSGLGLSYLRQP